MKLNVKILIILLSSFKSLFALTLDEAILKTSQTSDKIEQQDANISSYKARKFEELSQVVLPSVYLGYDKLDAIDGPSSTTKSLNVNYNLSALYKGSIGFYAGSKAIDAQILTANASKNATILEVVKLYLDVFEITKNIEIYQKSIELNDKIREQSKTKVQRGSLPSTSLDLIEVEIEEIKALIELEKSKLSTAKAKFFAITKLEAKNLIEPKLVNINYADVQDFLTSVKQNNIQIKALENQKKASKYDLSYSASDFLPDLNLIYTKSQSSDDITNSRIALSAKFYLYKPGLISGTIKKSYAYRASNFELAIAIDEKISRARELWSLYEYYQKTLTSKEKIVRVRNTIVQEQLRNYSLGRAEIIIALEEDKKLRDAELSLIKTKSEKILNTYRMKDLTGERLFEV
jgi:outer membrane protein TolC